MSFSRTVPAVSPAISIPVKFTDVRKRAGISFEQDSTGSSEKYYLETMGSGVGWLDYDQDGLMDLFFAQTAATAAYTPPHALRSSLYRNNGDGTFTDVTEKAGVGGEGHYAQGIAVGDYDNDGYPDLYVTGYGRAILYHNNRDGTFTDVTDKAGVSDLGQWSTSAAWFDYDRDGWLDLVVCNYVNWSPKHNLWCGEHRPGLRAYCSPNDYSGQRIALFHNNHDGTFSDVSLKSGVGKPEARPAALGDRILWPTTRGRRRLRGVKRWDSLTGWQGCSVGSRTRLWKTWRTGWSAIRSRLRHSTGSSGSTWRLEAAGAS